MSIDPRTGRVLGKAAPEPAPHQVDAACEAAAQAAPLLESAGRRFRARLLTSMAVALEGAQEDLVRVADQETALGCARLTGELARACYQFRLFADVLTDGSYLDVTIDHARDTALGPQPDLRRMLVPLGPAAVFGASNFPFAFSVAGGDTVSALAAGCPVVVKAHPSHPATSQACADVLGAAAGAVGAPPGTLALLHGLDAGLALARQPAICAIAFTGSLDGWRALSQAVAGRPTPIPCYAELSSLNPVVVTPSAAAERAEAIAAGVVTSITLGAGQFCTKPGLVLVPADGPGNRLLTAMGDAVTAMGPQWALNARIQQAFRQRTQALMALPHVRLLARAANGADPGPGFVMTPQLFVTRARNVDSPVTRECFGPAAVAAVYHDDAELLGVLGRLPGSLAAALHTGTGDTRLPSRVATVLRRSTGRLVCNGYPTGVSVAPAMHHGGPWPAASDPLHTSVGTAAIRRFLRPQCWQDAPVTLLPDELRNVPSDPVPRQVDGHREEAR
ncbi:MAG TPA: aldehyde dehydrogenase family protein [Streptosporangiaceae bacterium]|nr:aldehyde dehydrogenase family protein [Streptosporangiaceae bacterium]